MVNFIGWIAVGGVIGLLGSLALRTEGERGSLFNILVGMAGALIAELVLTPWFGIRSLTRSDFGLPGLMGAIALLAVVSGFRYLAQRYRPSE